MGNICANDEEKREQIDTVLCFGLHISHSECLRQYVIKRLSIGIAMRLTISKILLYGFCIYFTLPWKNEKQQKGEQKIDMRKHNNCCVHKTFIKYEILHHV